MHTETHEKVRKTYPAEDHNVAEILLRKDNSGSHHGFLYTSDLPANFVHFRELCGVPNKFLGSVAVLNPVRYCWCRDDNIGVVLLQFDLEVTYVNEKTKMLQSGDIYNAMTIVEFLTCSRR